MSRSQRHPQQQPDGGSSSSATALITVMVSSTLLVGAAVATWRLILWRARTRLQTTVQRVQDMLRSYGPLIDLNNPSVTERILDKSLKRASKWMTLREDLTTRPMVGQVGGQSRHKKPLLTVKRRIKTTAATTSRGENNVENSFGPPRSLSSTISVHSSNSNQSNAGDDHTLNTTLHLRQKQRESSLDNNDADDEDHEYVLKPLVTDHRGIREIAFYEAMEVVVMQHQHSSKHKNASSSVTSSATSLSSTTTTTTSSGSGSTSMSQAYAQFLSGGDIMGRSQGGVAGQTRQPWTKLCEIIDTVALALAMMFQDPVIQQKEEELNKAWKAVRKEADALHRLSKFVPRYRGVVRIGIQKKMKRQAKTLPSQPQQEPNQEQLLPQDHQLIPTAATRTNETTTAQSTVLTDTNPTPPSPPPTATATAEDGMSAVTPNDGSNSVNHDDEPSSNPLPSLSSSTSFGVTDDSYLLLQSLTRTYARPCVMDLKMGTETFEPDCSEEKRRRESTKYAKQTLFGFRIIGMRFYDPHHPHSDDKGFRLFPKNYGRSLLEREQVMDAFRLFFSSGLKKDKIQAETLANNGSTSIVVDDDDKCQRVRVKAVSSVLLQLRSLRRWFEENNTSLQFRASSLLFVYEGDPTRGGNGDVTMLKMIDFGHVRRVPGGDNGYLTGIKNLAQILTEILTDDVGDHDKSAQTT